jgi:hypothetical protein
MRWQDYRHVAGALIIGNDAPARGCLDSLHSLRLGLKRKRRTPRRDAISDCDPELTRLSSQSSL